MAVSESYLAGLAREVARLDRGTRTRGVVHRGKFTGGRVSASVGVRGGAVRAWLCGVLFCLGLPWMVRAAEDRPAGAFRSKPVPLILDTDMGNDIDDALALAMIHALSDLGEAKLLAVTVSKDETWSVPYIDVVNTFYGRPDVPIGAVRNGKTPEPSKFTEPVAGARQGEGPLFPHDLRRGEDAPEAVGLLRRTLAAWPEDGRIALVVVGFSTNIARLLDSKPDDVSPLDGRALIAKKVGLLSIMAGAFGPDRKPEYNVVKDIPAAQRVYELWPTPIVASGFEIGLAIKYPAGSIEKDYGYVEHHPIRMAYEAYLKMPYDRPCWDLTSVLYAVRPDAGYFGLSKAGRIRVDEEGITHFKEDSGGRDRYLTVTEEQVERVLRACVELSSKPPSQR